MRAGLSHASQSRQETIVGLCAYRACAAKAASAPADSVGWFSFRPSTDQPGRVVRAVQRVHGHRDALGRDLLQQQARRRGLAAVPGPAPGQGEAGECSNTLTMMGGMCFCEPGGRVGGLCRPLPHRRAGAGPWRAGRRAIHAFAARATSIKRPLASRRTPTNAVNVLIGSSGIAAPF